MTAPAPRDECVRAFIDTNVIVAYAKGTPDAVALFSAPVVARTHYLINAIVAQELMLGDVFDRYPELAPKVEKLTMIPLEEIDSGELIEKSRNFRHRSIHVNEFIIFASAEDCDFLITYDDKFKILRQGGRPSIVTPREFLKTIAAG